MKDTLTRIGRFARHERDLEGLTRPDIASETGLSTETIRRFEIGEPVGLVTFLLILAAIGYEHDDGIFDFFADLRDFEPEA